MERDLGMIGEEKTDHGEDMRGLKPKIGSRKKLIAGKKDVALITKRTY